MDRLKLVFPYLLLGLMTAVVVLSNLSAGGSTKPETLNRITMCAPCGMDVDPDIALRAEIRGRTH